MSSLEPARNKLEGLQVLRALAAFLVLWCHLKYNLGRDVGSFSSVRLLSTDFGAIGVDIFFVISGFVISMTAAKMADNWRGFLASRIARIVPLYFAVSTYVLLEAIISRDPGGRTSIRSIFDTYAFIPLFDGRTFTGPISGNGWTLSFEMWFYLCFAGLVKFGSARRAWLLLPGFFAAGCVATMAFYQAGPWFLPRFLFHPMTLEFCAGCVLYHMRDRIGKSTLYIMGGLGLLFLYLAWNSSTLGLHRPVLNDAKLGLHRAIVWGGFATCLVGIMSQIDLRYCWKWPAFLLLLGDASYSIYLVPEALMTTFTKVINHAGKFAGHDLMPSPVWCAMIYILGSMAAGIASWKLFELPTNSLVKRFLFRFVPGNQGKQKAPTANLIKETSLAGE